MSPHRANSSDATGLLKRKKRFTRAYSESVFILTSAGFLNECAVADDRKPLFSLFLPRCTLGPPSAAAHKFLLEGRNDATAAAA